jgi:Ca2+:H+ antiporter
MNTTLANGPTRSHTVSLEEGNLSGPGDKKQLKNIQRQLKETLFNNWVNILLVFVPAGIATHYAGVDPYAFPSTPALFLLSLF